VDAGDGCERERRANDVSDTYRRNRTLYERPKFSAGYNPLLLSGEPIARVIHPHRDCVKRDRWSTWSSRCSTITFRRSTVSKILNSSNSKHYHVTKYIWSYTYLFFNSHFYYNKILKVQYCRNIWNTQSFKIQSVKNPSNTVRFKIRLINVKNQF